MKASIDPGAPESMVLRNVVFYEAWAPLVKECRGREMPSTFLPLFRTRDGPPSGVLGTKGGLR